ncbi:MAG: SAVED domain-containing protein [Hydrogenobacter sp.]
MLYSFSSFKEEDLLGFLHSGELNEHITDVFKEFHELSPFVQFELIKYVKEKSVYVDVHVLSKVLGTSQKTAEEILRGEFKFFTFPAVSTQGSSQMVQGMVIKDTSQRVCNVEGIKRHIKPVEDLLKSRGLLKDHLSVFLNSYITGRSFQLSLALSLLTEKVPDRFCFTGGVDAKGNVQAVDNIPQKEKACRSFGKRLISPVSVRSVDDIVDWFSKPFVDVPFVITKERGRPNIGDFWEEEHALKNLRHFHEITEEDLILETGQLEGQKWQEVCIEFINRIRRLDSELSDRLRLNLVINGPTALAMAFGILYSHTRPFRIFHYSNSEKKYYPVDVSNTRELKERVKEYIYTDAQLESSDGEDLAVIIRGAHHDPTGDVKAYLKKEGISADILVLSPKEKEGNIPPDQLKDIAKEYASHIQSTRAQKHYENIHFFLSAPVVIGYLIGVAFGHYSNGYIHNYKSGYERVLSLEFLRDLIEKA